MNSLTEIERIARHRITERTTPTHAVPRRPHRGRRRMAEGLRRVADRLEPTLG